MTDPGQEPAVQVRSDFRSTAFWQPDVVTGTDGKAFIKVKYPDSVTTWKAVARAASAGNQFGLGSGTTRTQQPLIVRLQAPRFFVVGDRATVSAVINNNTDQPMSVTPSLNAEGLEVQQAKIPSPAKARKAGAECHGRDRRKFFVSLGKGSCEKIREGEAPAEPRSCKLLIQNGSA